MTRAARPSESDWREFLKRVGEQAECPAEVARELGCSLRSFRSDARHDVVQRAVLEQALNRRRVRRRLHNLTPGELIELQSIVDGILKDAGA